MNRRELLRNIAVITGATVVGGELFLTGCKTGTKNDVGFSPETVAFLDEVGETIIPTTTTPGAKAAQIGAFMKTMVTDCYTMKEQAAFNVGVAGIDENCKKVTGKTFIESNPPERTAYLTTLAKEADAFDKQLRETERPKREAQEKLNSTITWKDQKPYVGEPNHYFTMLRQLTLLGFFTSKTGMTETLRHVSVPGRYDGEVAYVKGEKAWAE